MPALALRNCIRARYCERPNDARFPDLGMGVAIDIGSKAAMGEMKWG